MTTNLQVAETIRQQLGGARFAMMTGAKNFVGGENMLLFSVGRGAKAGINRVRVTLDPSDTAARAERAEKELADLVAGLETRKK